MANKKTLSVSLIILILVTITVTYILLGNNNLISDNSEPVSEYFNDQWAMEDLWDDGKAEVAIYKAEKVIYNEIRNFDYVYILVKETFNKEYNVKTDDYDRNDLFDVMKVNKFARIETDEYPYHFLSSLFFIRKDPVELYKFTNGSQEWCGNTFKHFNLEDDRYVYYFDSYFDQEGRGEMKLPGHVLFEDQLSYTLRTLNFNKDLEFNYPVVASQVTNRAQKPKIYRAKIMVKPAKDPVDVNKQFISDELWQVDVFLEENKFNSYWFSKEYPNYLIKMRAWDGRKLLLDSLDRYAYW